MPSLSRPIPRGIMLHFRSSIDRARRMSQFCSIANGQTPFFACPYAIVTSLYQASCARSPWGRFALLRAAVTCRVYVKAYIARFYWRMISAPIFAKQRMFHLSFSMSTKRHKSTNQMHQTIGSQCPCVVLHRLVETLT